MDSWPHMRAGIFTLRTACADANFKFSSHQADEEGQRERLHDYRGMPSSADSLR